MDDKVEAWLKLPTDQRIYKVPKDAPLFRKALDKFPEAELEADRKVILDNNMQDDLDIRSAAFKESRVESRWQNSICAHCKGYGEPRGNLIPCLDCGLTFYCNKKHRKKHRCKHEEWCRNAPDVPVDVKCPYRLVVYKCAPQHDLAYLKHMAQTDGVRKPVTGLGVVPGRNFPQAMTVVPQMKPDPKRQADVEALRQDLAKLSR